MSRILLTHVLRAALLFVCGAGLLFLLVLGLPEAIGVLVGGALVVLSGGGLVLIVTRMLEPGGGAQKGVLAGLLVVKLVVVAALLWAALARWDLSGIGLIAGMGAGVGALVVGLNRGSSSAEGQRAMDEQAERLRKQ